MSRERNGGRRSRHDRQSVGSTRTSPRPEGGRSVSYTPVTRQVIACRDVATSGTPRRTSSPRIWTLPPYPSLFCLSRTLVDTPLLAHLHECRRTLRPRARQRSGALYYKTRTQSLEYQVSPSPRTSPRTRDDVVPLSLPRVPARESASTSKKPHARARARVRNRTREREHE